MLEEGRGEEFDRLFDGAVDGVNKTLGAVHPIYIGGKEAYSTTTLVEHSPINRNINIGYFQKGGREHAKVAIAAALAAFETWQHVGYKERAGLFTKFAELVSKNKFELGAVLSLENGKSRYESMGEVDEAIDFTRYYVNELLLSKGYLRKTSSVASKARIDSGFQGAPSNAEKVRIALRPYGVFGVVAPFNFPISISTGMSVAAMITGNTVVFKPSCTENMTMLSGFRLCRLLAEAGLPEGVFNFVTGPGSEIGAELVENKDVSGIAFTGSRSTGLEMIRKSYSLNQQKVFVVEMGGKNPAIVSKTADIDAAASGVASAAFGFSGQKCSALSRVYVHESVKEMFISKVIERMRAMQIGNPLNKNVFIGPLISEQAFSRYTSALEKIKASGRLLYGGNTVDTGLAGSYVEPVLAELRQSHELVHDELFVPVLLLIPFKSFDEAVRMANDTEYGLTAGLYSKNKKEIELFSKKIEAGVVYVNRSVSATTGAIVGLHTFVGWKGSGLTGKGTGSKLYLQQFMREQSVSLQ
jgi:1-pyrroline-5-carboxylate dehydrogenase